MKATLLKGSTPPTDFVDNGCSYVPDFWFTLAGRYHDWAYHKIRRKINILRKLKQAKKPLRRRETKGIAMSLEVRRLLSRCLDNSINTARLKAYIKKLKANIKRDRRTADLHFRDNIRILSRDGSKWRQYAGWFLSRRYSGAVRRWGWIAVRR